MANRTTLTNEGPKAAATNETQVFTDRQLNRVALLLSSDHCDGAEAAAELRRDWQVRRLASPKCRIEPSMIADI